MTITRCFINGCQWEQYRDNPEDARKLREHHEMLRHPDVYGAATNQPLQTDPIRQLADVDWWTQAIDAIASYQPGARFTIYEACAHLDEPPTAGGWAQLARDAKHLDLIRDVGGVNSKRPGTKGSKTTLWERTEKRRTA